MKNSTVHTMPFWETLGRSFKYALKNKLLLISVLPVIGALVLIQILLGLPFACSFGSGICSTGWSYYLTLLSLVAAAAGIIINYCRSIVCKANVDFISRTFWKQMGLYLLAKLFTLFVVSIPVVASIVAVSYLSKFNEQIILVAMVIIPLIFCIAFSPLFLLFPAISVEDYKMISWRNLFETAKGNFNAIFWGQFIISIPYWLLFRMCVELYQIIGINSYGLNLVFVTVCMFLAIVDACFKGAYFAFIYQHFKFYTEKQ